MAEILFINPNIVFPVNAAISGRALPARNIEKVINLGLLSIASYLDAKGISVRIIDLVGCLNDQEKIQQAIEDEQPYFVGISCISCYAYPKLEEYAGLIKGIDNNIFVMAGGQHVLGIPKITMEEIPSLDCVVRGEGEFVTYDIIRRLKKGGSLEGISSIAYRENGKIFDNTESFAQVANLDDLAFLRYDLYPNFKEYVPHVEESRNCSFSCNFCTAAFVKGGIRHKSVQRFIEEVNYIKSLYGDRKEKLKFFFACSNFGLKKKRIEELIQLLKEKEVNVSWRTQTRVDTPVVHYLDQLADVGLSVLDLGLESASINTLKLMNKTKNGERYIDKARNFIKKAGAIERILLKVNLVWFAGETPDTIRETTSFMLEHAEYIDGISVGPVMVYANTPLARNLSEYEKKYGTTVVEGAFWDRVHAYQVNPSVHFSYDQMNAYAQVVSKMLSPEKEYFGIKSYGQFPLDMTFEDFQKTYEQELHNMPFNVRNSKDILAVISNDQPSIDLEYSLKKNLFLYQTSAEKTEKV